MEAGEAPQSSGSGCRRRARIEVFEALLEDPDVPVLLFMGVFGVVLLHSCNHKFLIFDSTIEEFNLISPEGLLTLPDPDCSVPVEDEVVLDSWFINPFVGFMTGGGINLWNDKDGMDQLLCKKIEFFPCKLHVSFAVYRDPVEAHLDIYFMDLEYGEEDALIEVDGTVTASNSLLQDSKAKSVLFQNLRGKYLSLKAGNSVPLTLSRRMTVIPHRSTLLVHVDLQLQVCMGHGHPLLFKGTLEFNPGPDYAEQFIIPPNCGGKLLVKVTWLECEDRLE